MTAPERACLVIVDIAGYTGYLAGVELDHAQDILADLVDTVVTSLRPTFRLAKLEGDAAFAYTVADTLDAAVLQDAIETTYGAFRRRLRDIGQATRCECDACIRIPVLDLKAIVHHGLIARQRMAGLEELVGRDVILVHRLLKNTIEEDTGIPAYAFYTAATMEALGVADPAAQGLVAHREVTDLGEVDGWVRDLDAAWAAQQAGSRLEVTADDAVEVLAFETPAPRALAWEFVTSPIRRPQWGPGLTAIVDLTPDRRRGTGTTNHCMHGKDAIVEEILDWVPYDYWTTRATIPMPGAPKLVMTDAFSELPGGGTRVETRVGRPKPRERAAFQPLLEMIGPIIRASTEALGPALAAELERRANERETTPAEPEPPQSAGRYAREPISRRPEAVDSAGSRSS